MLEIFHANQTFTSELKVRLVALNMFKPTSYFTDRSKAVILLWIFLLFICVFVMLSSTFLAALWSSAWKG